MTNRDQLTNVDALDYDVVRPAFNSVYEFTVRRRLGGLPAEFNTLDLMGPSIDRMISDTAAEIVEMIPEEIERLRKSGNTAAIETLEGLSQVLGGC